MRDNERRRLRDGPLCFYCNVCHDRYLNILIEQKGESDLQDNMTAEAQK